MKDILLSIDTETTGVDPSRDRIIQIGYVLYNIKDKSIIDSDNIYIRPEGEYSISKEATETHGLTKDFIDAKGVSLKSISSKLKEFLENYIVLTYNGSRFDICLIIKELSRIGIDVDIRNTTFIDSIDIERYFNNNTLESAYKRYYNDTPTDSHDAISDARTTLKVFLAQLKNHDRAEISNIIDNTTKQTKVSPEGYCKDNNGTLVFNIGKYRNRSTNEICESDPNYIKWLFNSDILTKQTKEAIKSSFIKISYKNE